MKVRWMPQAQQDLHAIQPFIAQDNPATARRWVARLRERARAAATAPMAGRVVPELEMDDVREVFLRSYRVVYRVVRNEVHVLTVFEGHRLFFGAAVPDSDEGQG